MVIKMHLKYWVNFWGEYVRVLLSDPCFCEVDLSRSDTTTLKYALFWRQISGQRQ